MNHGPVMQYFKEITQIPRTSEHEEKMRDYLLSFAGDHGLAVSQDIAGNVCIRKPAAAGHENAPVTVLQAHMNMVCEKDPNTATRTPRSTSGPTR